MCGRYELNIPIGALMQITRDIAAPSGAIDMMPGIRQGEICPSDSVPVITKDGLAVMRWGFPNPASNGLIINARAETVRQKYMFSTAIAESRLVVPTNGFYEWSHFGGKAKDKYLFGDGQDTLFLAGVHAKHVTNRGLTSCFVILTVDANASVRSYHDRMPLIIRREDILAWLHSDDQTDAFLRQAQPSLHAKSMTPPAPEQLSFL